MLTRRAHTLIRVVSLLVFAGAIGWAVWRYQRSPEQEELTAYVEKTTPWLRRLEAPALERIESLWRPPTPKPEEARHMLVDEVIPQLLKLKKQITDYAPRTDAVRALHDEYRQVTERLIEACRACVRVIDDPKVSTGEGVLTVKREFAAVRAAYETWREHLAAACRAHHLTPPAKS